MKKSKSIKDVDEKELIKDLKRLNTVQMSDKYDLSSSNINNLRAKYNIKDYPRMRKKKENIPSVDKLENKTLQEVMKEYGVCRSTASRWFRERGIPWRLSEKNKYLKYEILKLKKQNRLLRIAAVFPFMTNAQIARAYGYSRERIRQFRNELGIPYVSLKDIDYDIGEEKKNEKEN